MREIPRKYLVKYLTVSYGTDGARVGGDVAVIKSPLILTTPTGFAAGLAVDGGFWDDIHRRWVMAGAITSVEELQETIDKEESSAHKQK